MSKSSLITPCPAPTSGIRQHRLSCLPSASDTNEDTTTTIDFTRALGPSIKGSKPRRSSLLHGKASKRAPVTIFEDVQEDEDLLPSQNQQVLKGKTLLCKPAKKMAFGTGRAAAGMAMAVAGSQHQEQHQYQQSGADSSESRPAPRRSSLRDIGLGPLRPTGVRTDHVDSTGLREHRRSMATAKSSSYKETNEVKKEPRRRTIWIPEDTTLLTIHPGAANTAQLDDTFQLSDMYVPPPQQHEAAIHDGQDQSALQKPMRRPRKSLMAAPRRGPLVMQDVDHKQNTEGWNVCGDNTGKENVPPAGFAKFKISVSNSPEAILQNYLVPRVRHTQQRVHATSIQPARPSVNASARTIGGNGQRSNIGRPIQVPEQLKPLRYTPEDISHNHQLIPKFSEAKQKQELRATISSKRLEVYQAKSKQYPVLSESLPHASLYENEWLDQQEVALTEVINALFAASPATANPLPHSELRKGMIELYHQDTVVMLHGRIQASLRVGFLAKPQSLSTLELSHDLGLTKQFMNLWTKSYTEEALRAAVEVVTGHAVEDTSADSKSGRRALIEFIQTFFVFVGDVKCPKGTNPLDPIAAKARWEKTMERSLMLVWLLDQAKTTDLIRGTLFNEMSSNKSSLDILRALSKIVSPSIGDIAHVLGNLGYQVKHVQNSLDEVRYQVKNLAVDLRDGILLTHLVEILLYPRPASSEVTYDDLAKIFIPFPDTTILESDLYTPDLCYNTRILSQHLRIPCLSRSLKEYNVQIAFNALESHSVDSANAVADISPIHIVHGHRERTLSLLWSLVSNYGLDYLVDWQELASDIDCTRGLPLTAAIILPKQGHITPEQREMLLFMWADVHLGTAGMPRLDNYNTSFTDGSPYLAIMEGFEPYIIEFFAETPLGRSPRTLVDLKVQLQRIGCSTAFINQLTLSVGMIPHRNTTISNLAFLASRLLPLRKKHFAALVIQRAWRNYRAPIIVSQRIALMRLAHDCAVIVQTREEIEEEMIAAATVIQRAFRRMVRRNLDAIDQSFLDFQNLARGWFARKAFRRSPGGGSGDARVMGGW